MSVSDFVVCVPCVLCRLVEVFESLELAQDLFFQYVCDDPISPQAKRAFVSR